MKYLLEFVFTDKTNHYFYDDDHLDAISKKIKCLFIDEIIDISTNEKILNYSYFKNIKLNFTQNEFSSYLNDDKTIEIINIYDFFNDNTSVKKIMKNILELPNIEEQREILNKNPNYYNSLINVNKIDTHNLHYFKNKFYNKPALVFNELRNKILNDYADENSDVYFVDLMGIKEKVSTYLEKWYDIDDPEKQIYKIMKEETKVSLLNGNKPKINILSNERNNDNDFEENGSNGSFNKIYYQDVTLNKKLKIRTCVEISYSSDNDVCEYYGLYFSLHSEGSNHPIVYLTSNRNETTSDIIKFENASEHYVLKNTINVTENYVYKKKTDCCYDAGKNDFKYLSDKYDRAVSNMFVVLNKYDIKN